MNEKRCIYCSTDNDLSKSDIIPDALTNARITNRNVCRIDHNNRYSDLFESEVITALAFIANKLDIKSSKGKGYPRYNARIKIDNIEYPTRLTSKAEMFIGRVLKSADKKYRMDFLEKNKTIAKESDQVKEVDQNSRIIAKEVDISLSIYFDQAIFRLVAKIAYEWYCARNNVSGYHNNFRNIVKFITEGTEEGIISIVQEPDIYKLCAHELNLGSHCLLAFQGPEKKINVIVNLFGIVMYRVVVCDHTPDFCNNNCLYQELGTDASRKEVFRKSVEELENEFSEYLAKLENFTFIEDSVIPLMISKEICSIDIAKNMHICNLIKYFSQSHDETLTPNAQINDILITNIREIIQASLLHKKSLKRFVKEHCKLATEPIHLNSTAINKEDVFMMYVLFIIGKNALKSIGDYVLQSLIKEALHLKAGEEIIISDKIEESLKREILENENYSSYIAHGADLVSVWE